MSAAGKHVLLNRYCDSDDEQDSIESSLDVGRFVRAPDFDPECEERNEDEIPDYQYEHYRREVDPNRENDLLKKKLAEMQRVIDELSAERNNTRQQDVDADDAEKSWNCFRDIQLVQPEGNNPAVRWDQMKPFPRNVVASKMWEEWVKYIENFEIAASLSNATDPVRRTKLLFLSMGEELQGIVRAAKLRPNLNSPDCYTTFTKNIDQHFRSMTDPTAEHEAFLSMQQEKGETAFGYHARLMEKVRLCRYSPSEQERFVQTQFLKGMTDRKLSKTVRILGYGTDRIVQSATRAEACQMETAQTTNTYDVNEVRGRSFGVPFKRRRETGSSSLPQRKRLRLDRPAVTHRRQERRERCSKCNRWAHRNRVCPADKQKCFECGRFGHYAILCRSRNVQTIEAPSPSQDRLREEMQSKIEEDELNALSLEDVLIECQLGSSRPVQFLIDSGADVNVIGGDDWNKLKLEYDSGSAKLQPIKASSNRGLRAYASSAPMEVECAFRARIQVSGSMNQVTADFLVVKNGKRSLLGRSTASDLKLLLVGPQVCDCEIVPDKIFPKMPGVKVKFSIDTTIPPSRNAYYNIPAAYREGARRRLKEMETSGIIERVTTAPEWISGMSAVAKGKDDFRLVVNMRAPNRAIKREYFRLPHMDEMKIKLHGAKYFTKLDLKNAYYHLELSEESRDLTTFLAEDGMFRFTRLMFGVNCAPEIFQREMSRILAGVKNKIVYIDDVLLFAESLEELHQIVAEVQDIFKRYHLTLNPAKCEYDKTEITFLGNKLDQDGFHIEEAKIAAIQKFRKPTTASELRSFLGLASYVSPYIRNFANISNPLWAVAGLKQWSWGDRQEKAFNELKEQIIKCTVTLGYFSEEDDTVLYSDASPYALGAVMVQESRGKHPRIISFASKALTKTEKGYAQNQREALAAVWSVEHFSYFLLGRHFKLRTDATGVAFIFNRSLEYTKRALTRADGWALRLSPYNYSIEYVKGRDNIADPSSRLYQGSDEPFDETTSPWEIGHIEVNPSNFLTEDEVRRFTRDDETLQQVMQALQSGDWPKHLRRFQAVSDDLSAKDDLLIKLGCVVIPEQLRRRTLAVAHSGHPMAPKLKSILRERVWWPGMAKDAEEWVKSCETCAVNGRPEKPTPMRRMFAPKAVWETIAVDFNGPYAKFGGVSILVMIDYRSRYAIARPVKSTSFENTKRILDDAFSKEGFPKAMKSDNGPPFNGEEYKNYCAERGIQPIFSTPFFPQQNGLVENFMKVVNKAMSTASSTGVNFNDELQAAVIAHNSAAHTVTRMAPEEVMYGRKIHRALPLINRGRVNINEQLLDKRDAEAKLHSKVHEDARRGAKPCQVRPGDSVIVERQSKAKGEARFDTNRHTVVQEDNGSLLLRDENDRLVRRHVTQTKRVHQWRSSEPTPTAEDADKRTGHTASTRPSRERRAPVRLSDYVRQNETDHV